MPMELLPVQGPNLVNDCIWVQSADGSMTRSVSKDFLTLVPWCNKEMLQGRGATAKHPCILPRQITPETLQVISCYVDFHSAPGRSDKERKQYDEKLVKMDTKRLCELTSAADSLEMRPLVDITSRGLARLIEGKSPEEIREAFNLPDDLTEEEKLEPVKNLINDPRIRLLNRLYAKKRRELHTKKIEAKKISDEQVKLQDSRPLEELLSFIEMGNGKQEGCAEGQSKESKAKKTKQKGKHKGDSSRDCSTTSQGAAADSTAATTQEKGQVAAAEEKGEEGEVVAVASLDQGAKKQCGLGGAVQLGALEALELQHSTSNGQAEGKMSPRCSPTRPSDRQQQQQQQHRKQRRMQQPLAGNQQEGPQSLHQRDTLQEPGVDPSGSRKTSGVQHTTDRSINPQAARRRGQQQQPSASSPAGKQVNGTTEHQQHQQPCIEQHQHQVLLPPPLHPPSQLSNGTAAPQPEDLCHQQPEPITGSSSCSIPCSLQGHDGDGTPLQHGHDAVHGEASSAHVAGFGAGCSSGAPWETRVHELLFSKAGCSRSSRLPALPVLEDCPSDADEPTTVVVREDEGRCRQ